MGSVADILPDCVSENPTCLVCIARRVPMTEKVNVMLGIDQFTTKQDLQGVILASDVRSVSTCVYISVYLSATISKCVCQSVCHNLKNFLRICEIRALICAQIKISIMCQLAHVC